jgi:hypothetical protein
VNRGNTVASFLEKIPTQFVVGVEANPFLASMLTFASSNHSVVSTMSGMSGNGAPYCGSIYGELGTKAAVLEKVRVESVPAL